MYDVQCYLTQDDYNACKFNVMHGGVANKRLAIRLARKILKKKNNPFAIVKVRCWSGQWDQILTPYSVKNKKDIKPLDDDSQDVLEANLYFKVSKRFKKRFCEYQDDNRRFDNWPMKKLLDSFVQDLSAAVNIISIKDQTVGFDKPDTICVKVWIIAQDFHKLSTIKKRMTEFLQTECDKWKKGKTA